MNSIIKFFCIEFITVCSLPAIALAKKFVGLRDPRLSPDGYDLPNLSLFKTDFGSFFETTSLTIESISFHNNVLSDVPFTNGVFVSEHTFSKLNEYYIVYDSGSILISYHHV